MKISNSIFHKLLQKKDFVIDTSQIFINKGLNSLVPFLLLPYYNKVFGLEQYGMLVYIQSSMALLMLISDYGFNVTGTRDVSVNSANIPRLSQIVSSVYFVKGLLILCCYVIIFISGWLGDWSANVWGLYLLTFTSFALQSLVPFWLFQGMKKNIFITIINAFSKALLLLLVFVLINNNSEILLVPLIESLSYLLAFLLSIFAIIQILQLPIVLPSISNVKMQLWEGKYIFIFSLLNWMIVSGAIIFVEKMLLPTDLGYFATFSRLMYYAFAIMQPLSQAVFPYFAAKSSISLEDQFKSFKIGFKYFVFLVCFFFVFCVILIKPFIVTFYDEQFVAGIDSYMPVLYVLILWVSLVSINYFVGLQFLVASKKDRTYVKYYSINALFAVVGFIVLIPSLGLLGAPLSMLLGEVVISILLFRYYLRFSRGQRV